MVEDDYRLLDMIKNVLLVDLTLFQWIL